jgi:hypothetical protein
MPAPLSAITKAIYLSLQDWATCMEPVAGVVTVAADELEGMDMLARGPKAWDLILWANGEVPVADNSDELVRTQLRVGLSMARGMAARPGLSVIEGRDKLPAVMDVIEGTVRTLRGMHTKPVAPAALAADCWLLRYRGWQWVKFLTGVNHFTVQMDFTLDRQMIGRLPTRVEI